MIANLSRQSGILAEDINAQEGIRILGRGEGEESNIHVNG